MERIRLTIHNWKYILRLRKILGTSRVVLCCTEEEERQFSRYVTYGVQRALYEIHLEENPEITWEEFVDFFAQTPKIRQAACRAAIDAVADVDISEIEFSEIPTETLFSTCRIEQDVCLAEVFEREAGVGLVTLFMFKAEMAHFCQLVRKKKNKYTFKKYMKDLRRDQQLMKELCWGLERSFHEIDYKAAWRSERVQKMLE